MASFSLHQYLVPFTWHSVKCLSAICLACMSEGIYEGHCVPLLLCKYVCMNKTIYTVYVCCQEQTLINDTYFYYSSIFFFPVTCIVAVCVGVIFALLTSREVRHLCACGRLTV